MAINATVDGVTYSGIDTINTGGKVIGLEAEPTPGQDFDAYVMKTISNVNCSASYVGTGAFQSCYALETAIFPNCKQIYQYGFAFCSVMSSISFPELESIYQSAFLRCDGLESVELPVISVGDYGFTGCYGLKFVNLPSAVFVGTYAFNGCNKLIEISIPAVTSLAKSVFNGCVSLSQVYAPSVVNIDAGAFFNCNSLSTIAFPELKSIANNTFKLTGLISFSASKLTSIGQGAFASCYSLTRFYAPLLASISDYCFERCYELSDVYFMGGGSIYGQDAFNSCYNLLSLQIAGSSVTLLGTVSAFKSTPIDGYTASTGGVLGSIYVPASLLTAYQSATNWAFFSERFVGV